MPVDTSSFHPIIAAAMQLANQIETDKQRDIDNKFRQQQQAEVERQHKEVLAQAAKRLQMEETQQNFQNKVNLFNLEQTLRSQFATGQRRPEVFQDGGPLKTTSRSAVLDTPFGKVGLSDLVLPEDIRDQKIAEIQATTPALVGQHRALKQVDVEAEMPKLQATLNAANQRAQATNVTRLLDAQIKAAASKYSADMGYRGRVDAASIAHKNDGAAAAQDATQLFGRIASGDMTEETLTKEVPIKGRLAVANAANANGLKILKDSQMKRLQGLAVLNQVYNKYKELDDVIQSGVVSNAGKWYTLNKEADSLLGNMARLLGGEKGVLTQKDVDRAAGARPGVVANLADKTANKRRMNDFLNFYNTEVKATLGNVGPDQQKALFDRFNIINQGGAKKVLPKDNPDLYEEVK